jgi:hypothetical protein
VCCSCSVVPASWPEHRHLLAGRGEYTEIKLPTNTGFLSTYLHFPSVRAPHSTSPTATVNLASCALPQPRGFCLCLGRSFVISSPPSSTAQTTIDRRRSASIYFPWARLDSDPAQPPRHGKYLRLPPTQVPVSRLPLANDTLRPSTMKRCFLP